MFGKKKNNQNNGMNNPNNGMNPGIGGRPGFPPQNMNQGFPQGGNRPPQNMGMPPQGNRGMNPQNRIPQQGKPGKGKKGLLGGLFGKKKNPQQGQMPQQGGMRGPQQGRPPMSGQRPPQGMPPMGGQMPQQGMPQQGRPPMGGQRPPQGMPQQGMPLMGGQMQQNPNQRQPIGNQMGRRPQIPEQPPMGMHQDGYPLNDAVPNRIPDLNTPGSQREVEVNSAFRPSPGQSRANASAYDVDRQYFSSQESKEVYGQKEMQQNIFLYAPKTNFISIQKYINENYTGAVVMGTSALADVIDVYKQKLNCQNVIMFVGSEEELTGLIPFIEFLISIKRRNPEVLNIYIIICKNVRNVILKNVNAINLCNILQTQSGIETLSAQNVDDVMAEVVKRQPTYLDTKIEKVSIPKKAKRRKTVDANNLFRLKNIDELKKEVNQNRSSTDDEKLYNKLRNSLLEAKSVEDVNNMVDMIPELSVLKEYADELNEYLEESDGSLSISQLNEIALSKLELNNLQQEVLEEIFGSVIKYAERSADVENEKVRNYNRGIVANLEKVDDTDVAKLLEQREVLKERVTAGFTKYKTMVQATANAIEAQRILTQQLQTSLKPILEDGTFSKIDNDTKVVTKEVMLNLEKLKRKHVQENKDVQNTMMETLSYVNSLYRELNVVIKLDDVIIDKLIEDKNRAETASINKIYNVDNELKARSKVLYVLDKGDFRKLTKAIYDRSFLVVTNISELEFSEKVKVQTSTQFVEGDYTERDVNVVRIMDWEDRDRLEDRVNLMISKLKFISKYFKKVIFIFDDNIDDYIRNKVLDEVAEFIVMTDIEKEKLIKTNSLMKLTDNYKGIFGRSIIYNKYDPETCELSMNEIRTMANVGRGIKEIFIDTYKSLRSRDELTKIVVQFRQL